MAENFRLVFGDQVEEQEDTVIEEEPFGSIGHFKLNYNEKVNNFLADFLHNNIESVISNCDGDLEQIKIQIGNLVEVYYQARIEFEKYKNRLIY